MGRSRKTWLSAGAIAVAALALVAGALLTRPASELKSARPDSAGPAAKSTPSADGSGAAVPRAPAGASPGTPTPGSPRRPRQADEQVMSPDDELISSAPPAAPVAEGRELQPLSSPPEATVAMLDASAATPNSRYQVSFRPYGEARGGGVVMLVTNSAPLGNVPDPFQFEGRNVLVAFESAAEADVVTEGGDYRGVIQLRANQGVLVPILISVERGD